MLVCSCRFHHSKRSLRANKKMTQILSPILLTGTTKSLLCNIGILEVSNSIILAKSGYLAMEPHKWHWDLYVGLSTRPRGMIIQFSIHMFGPVSMSLANWISWIEIIDTKFYIQLCRKILRTHHFYLLWWSLNVYFFTSFHTSWC